MAKRVWTWVICSVLLAACAMTNESATDEAEPESRMTVIAATVTPLYTPTPVPLVEETREPVCADLPITSRMIVYERGRVTDNGRKLNLRVRPDTNAGVLRLLQPGAVFDVIGGPQCANGYAWFQIRYEGREGWIAEGDDTGYFAEPYLAG
jgi:hypothetical protein